MLKSKFDMRKLTGMMIIVIVLAIGIFAADNARAKEDYARTGSYIGLGITNSIQDFPDFGELAGLDSSITFDDSLGIDLKFGSRMSNHFAMELEFLYNFGFECDEKISNNTSDYYGGYSTNTAEFDATISIWTLFFNLKGYLAKGRIQPYGVVGVGFSFANLDMSGNNSSGYSLTESQSYSDNSVKFGAGIDFYATDRFVLFLEGAMVIGGVDELDEVNFNPITLGFLCRF